MTVVEALKEGRELLSDPARWTKGPLAQDAEGNGVYPTNPVACKFCSLGALTKITGTEYTNIYHEAKKIFEFVPEVSEYIFIADWNDAKERTHEELLAGWDKAITIAEEQNV